MRLFAPPVYVLCLLCALIASTDVAVAAGPSPEPMTSPKALPLKEKPDDGSRTLMFIQRGERLWKMSETDPYTRIKIKRGPKWIAGYVLTEDLDGPIEEVPLAKTLSNFGLGFGLIYSRLSQNGKSFETDDEVKWNLSSFTSQSVWPYLIAQWRRENFWRVRFGYRLTKFKGSAQSDVSTTAEKNVEINHRMLSLALDRTWSFGPFYVGGGAEMARALSLTLKLGGADLPTTSQDLPTYLGFGGVIGAQRFVIESLSLIAELRVTAFMNQQQPITALEGGAAAIYWY